MIHLGNYLITSNISPSFKFSPQFAHHGHVLHGLVALTAAVTPVDTSGTMGHYWKRKAVSLCVKTALSTPRFGGSHVISTLSARPPSSLRDHSLHFEWPDRSGLLVADQSSSVRLLRLKFTSSCSHCVFILPLMTAVALLLDFIDSEKWQ